jgi:hypothetical protein
MERAFKGGAAIMVLLILVKVSSRLLSIWLQRYSEHRLGYTHY